MTLTQIERALLRDAAGLLARLGADPVTVVTSAADLQPAIDAAVPGDILQLSGQLVGQFTLPDKEGWVTLRGPGELRSPSNLPVLQVGSRWRLEGLTFTAASPLGDLVRIGTATQTLEVPHDVMVERCQFLGDPVVGQKRGLTVNGGRIVVTNCRFLDIKAVGQDSQAIIGWNGPGPVLIEHCHIEAAGENILFGGVDPSIPGVLMSDVTIRHNTIRKPLEWRGQGWQCKNLLELKAATHVTIEDNTFEHNWASGAGSGYAVWLKSTNQDGGQPWAEVSDVTLHHNRFLHVSGGISLHYGPQGPNVPMARINLHENLWVVSKAAMGGLGRFLSIVGVDDVSVVGNTVLTDGDVTLAAEGRPSARFVLERNVLVDRLYGIKGAGTGEGAATLAAWFPGATLAGNVIETASPQFYPAGFTAVSSLEAVGFDREVMRFRPDSPYAGVGWP